MRDFLFSEIATIHGLANVPDDPDLAIAAGTRLCETILEPLQDVFGRIAVRSSFRSAEVNGYGSRIQATTNKAGYTCASNASNAAGHIWDLRSSSGHVGAAACIIVPGVWDRFHGTPGGWQKLAWWIHDHLPYSEMTFFPEFWAFNISSHDEPARSIYSEIRPGNGYLTRTGWDNNIGDHETEWSGILP